MSILVVLFLLVLAPAASGQEARKSVQNSPADQPMALRGTPPLDWVWEVMPVASSNSSQPCGPYFKSAKSPDPKLPNMIIFMLSRLTKSNIVDLMPAMLTLDRIEIRVASGAAAPTAKLLEVKQGQLQRVEIMLSPADFKKASCLRTGASAD